MKQSYNSTELDAFYLAFQPHFLIYERKLKYQTKRRKMYQNFGIQGHTRARFI